MKHFDSFLKMSLVDEMCLFLADIGATPFGLNSLGGLAGLESLGLGQSTFMDLQVRILNYHVFNYRCALMQVQHK